MTSSGTISDTYTDLDIEGVMRRTGADFRMIAESTGAITLSRADDYRADIELLAKQECLSFVDITLFDGSEEVKAVRYTVNSNAGGLTSDRPGGVLWPRVRSPWLRVTLGTTDRWDSVVASGKLSGKLRISWTTSYADLSHGSLTGTGGRNYVSNAYGVIRQDYSR